MASDQVVNTKNVLQALIELRRVKGWLMREQDKLSDAGDKIHEYTSTPTPEPPSPRPTSPGSGTDPFDGVPMVFACSRQQSIEDGVLVDMTPWAQETGFVTPVACTAAVWHGYVVPAGQSARTPQSERGRAHNLLWMLWCAIKHSDIASYGERLQFEVIFLMPPAEQRSVLPTAVCGPGDAGEPVVIIMLPDED